MSKYYHSIEVETDKCTGCMSCMRACPTEAMRIREGKALILEDRCIDCGDCIRVCPARAVRSMTGSFEDLTRFKYTIAIPSPPLYSQYGIGVTPNHILNGLKGLGFNEVYDIGRACEVYSAVLREHLSNYSDNKPYISTICLAVVRLIQINFPELMGNLLSMEAPSAIAGAYKTARAKILGISPQDIGTIFITPCPAKMIAVNHPIFKLDPTLDGAIAISDIYGVLFTAIRKISVPEPLHNSGGIGVGVGIPGACITSLEIENAIAVDGVHNVIKILEDVERGKITNVNYLELWACPGGCIGGPLAVDNPYLARIKAMKQMQQLGTNLNITPAEVERMRAHLSCDVELSTHPIQPLGMDAREAIKKIKERDSIMGTLPRINCGACGAPTCKAFAEDVVQGRAEIIDCVFKLKEATLDSIRKGLDMAQKSPLSVRKRGAGMKLKEIIDRLELKVAAGENLDREVAGGYASDLLSDVMANSREGDIWVTLQAHPNIIAVASLKGLSGIVLVQGRNPEEQTVEKARKESIPLMVTGLQTFEFVGRLFGLGISGMR